MFMGMGVYLNLGLLLLGQGWGDQRSDEDESQKKQDGGTNDDDPVQNADEDSGPFAPFSSTTEIIQFKLDREDNLRVDFLMIDSFFVF